METIWSALCYTHATARVVSADTTMLIQWRNWTCATKHTK